MLNGHPKHLETTQHLYKHWNNLYDNVEFDFCHYDGEVRTVYVREHVDSPNPVEFYMLETLQNRIQEINSRYRVGIIYQGE